MRASNTVPKILLPLFALLLFGCRGDTTGPAEYESELQMQLVVVPGEVHIVAGQSFQLSAMVKDFEGRLFPLPPGDDPAWESSNPAIAEVSGDGKVIAFAEGQVHITAGCNGYCAGAIVYVSNPSAPGR